MPSDQNLPFHSRGLCQKGFLHPFLKLLTPISFTSELALTTFPLGVLSDPRPRGQTFPCRSLCPSPYSTMWWDLTWEIRAVPETPSCRDLHWEPAPRTETRCRIRNTACRRFSKAAPAAAQREDCIASSAILSEERGTEGKGLWDAGGPNSATLISHLPLFFSGPQTGNNLAESQTLGLHPFYLPGRFFEGFTQSVM